MHIIDAEAVLLDDVGAPGNEDEHNCTHKDEEYDEQKFAESEPGRPICAGRWLLTHAESQVQ
jgi:hypothetical protein